MERVAAHHSRWRTADVVFGLSMALSFLINYFWPITLGVPKGSLILHLLGAPLLFGGSLIIIFSRRELLRFGQPAEPRQPTTRIVNAGLYKFSRNPMYTGLTLCYAGLGIAIDVPWLLIMLVPTLATVHFLLIRPEERYLEAKFGDEFLQYKKTVRRWI